MRGLFSFAAGVEIVTGLALLATPSMVASLLFGTELSGVAGPVARLAGVGLLSLGIACRPGKEPAPEPELGMLVYNALVALLLIIVGIEGTWVGVLLWPAVALHIVLTGLLAWAWFGRR